MRNRDFCPDLKNRKKYKVRDTALSPFYPWITKMWSGNNKKGSPNNDWMSHHKGPGTCHLYILLANACSNTQQKVAFWLSNQANEGNRLVPCLHSVRVRYVLLSPKHKLICQTILVLLSCMCIEHHTIIEPVGLRGMSLGNGAINQKMGYFTALAIRATSYGWVEGSRTVWEQLSAHRLAGILHCWSKSKVRNLVSY